MAMRNVPIPVAAALMGKGQQFVRIGLQRGLLPFGRGFTTKVKGKRHNYWISPAEFMRYTGASEEQIIAEARRQNIAIM